MPGLPPEENRIREMKYMQQFTTTQVARFTSYSERSMEWAAHLVIGGDDAQQQQDALPDPPWGYSAWLKAGKPAGVERVKNMKGRY
jgi:hypothetical protein